MTRIEKVGDKNQKDKEEGWPRYSVRLGTKICPMDDDNPSVDAACHNTSIELVRSCSRGVKRAEFLLFKPKPWLCFLMSLMIMF